MRLPIALSLLMFCLPLPLAAGETPEWFRVLSVPVKASALIGKEVRTAQDQHVGTVRDLVFDLEHNRVHHAVVGERSYPMHALEILADRLVLELPGGAFEQRWPDRRLLPATQLFGARFDSGKVLDVVLDAFWGNVAFALIGSADALRPVPLDAFHDKGGQLILQVDAVALQNIDPISLQELDARLRDTDFLRRTARLAHQLEGSRD